MPSLIERFFLIGVITCLSACATTTYEDYLKANEVKPDIKFSYDHKSPDYKVDWNTLQKGSDTVIDGRITNVRDMSASDINLYVVVLDPSGSELFNGNDLSYHSMSSRNQSFAFTVKLKDAIIAKGDILRFIIDYHLQDGRWGGNIMQSRFAVDATTGSEIKGNIEP